MLAEFHIRKGFDPSQRSAAAALYWDAFRGKLGKVMGPDDRALGFFEAALNPDFALSAVGADGRLLGIAGFKTKEGSLTDGTLHDMAQAYGWFGCFWRALLLSTLERKVAPGVLLMDGICVDAKARGLGLGTALLAAVKAEARQLGLSSVRLDVIDSNPRARALYEREGFEVVGFTRTGPLRHLFEFREATMMQCPV